MPSHHNLDVEAELSVLDALTAPTTTIAPQLPQLVQKPSHKFKRRDSDLDPLLLAAVSSSGPHVTRNHYAHDFFPAVGDPRAPGAWDWTNWTGEDANSKQTPVKASYMSRQAPRRERLKAMGIPIDEGVDSLQDKENTTRPALTHVENIPLPERLGLSSSEELTVKCMARTRIPTPYGQAFLHLYHNNKDQKEHLAIVVDPAQFDEGRTPGHSDTTIPAIRSQSLDAVWHANETAMERITRGAFVGRLSATTHVPSKPSPPTTSKLTPTRSNSPPPLVRIHSECFTGETVGSMRCDCGEQLDEALRLILQPITVSSRDGTSAPRTIPGRGVVVYLRQEGRGIGLLSKIRAYNLQDLGHDTVTANIMLGHKADERGYEIAGAILRDLNVGKDGVGGGGMRLLTNNPDKVEALGKEGLRIVERVSMVPRSWRKREVDEQQHVHMKKNEVGVTLIGGGVVHGRDLDKYLRTKVLRMGHMLPLVNDDGVLEVELGQDGMVY